MEAGVHPGMADAAERDQVSGVVVRGVAVDVVNVEVPFPAADGTPVPVALEDGVAYLFPAPQGVLLARPDGDREPLAVDAALAPYGKRAPAAEPAKTVPVGVVSAERGERAVERIKGELQAGGHAR